MATLTPTLTLSSTDVFADQPLNLSVTDSLTVQAPMTDISRMNTDDIVVSGSAAGIILVETVSTDVYYVYIKHTGLQSDGVAAATASDYIIITNADGDTDFARLYPGEFCFFPLNPMEGADGGIETGGLKVEAASSEVQINYAYWKRTA
jgi:hypothetical protein